jgi:hypothetical protein
VTNHRPLDVRNFEFHNLPLCLVKPILRRRRVTSLIIYTTAKFQAKFIRIGTIDDMKRMLTLKLLSWVTLTLIICWEVLHTKRRTGSRRLSLGNDNLPVLPFGGSSMANGDTISESREC